MAAEAQLAARSHFEGEEAQMIVLLLLALVLRAPERVSLSSFRPVPAHKPATWVGLGARGPPILL